MIRKTLLVFLYSVLLSTALSAQPLSSFRLLEEKVDSLYYSADYQSGATLLQKLLYNTQIANRPDSVTAYLHYKLGVFSLELAKYGDAEMELLSAKTFYSNIYSAHHPLVASVWSRLAVLYSEQSRYRDAIDAAQQQLDNYISEYGRNDRFTALAAIAVAEYHLLANDISGAEKIFSAYSSILTSSYGLQSNEYLRLLKLQGDIAFLKKQFSQAKNIYSTALTQSVNIKNIRLILRGKIELERARARTIIAEDDSALTDVERAVKDIKESQNSSLLLSAKCALVKGVIQEQQGAMSLAFQSFRSALELYKLATKENFRYTSERERLEFIRDITFNGGRVFSSVLRNIALHPEGNALAYDWLLFQKGIVLTSIQSTRTAAVRSGDTTIASLLDSIALLRSRRSALNTNSPLSLAKPYITADTLNTLINDLEKNIAQRSAKFSRFSTLGSLHWTDIKQKLSSDACAIEITTFPYYEGERKTDSIFYSAFSISHKDQFAPRSIFLGNSSSIDDPAIMREYFRALDPQSKKRRDALTLVSKLLWSPLERLTDSFKTIYISPDGIYSQVSFASLNLDAKTQLIDKYRIGVVANTADILRDSSSTNSNSVTIFADPNYEDAAATERVKTITPVASLKPLERLPATRQEATSITGLFKKANWKATTLLGVDAEELQLEKVSRPEILHIATHGRFAKNNADSTQRDISPINDLLDCSLYFGGANTTFRSGTTDASNDGILTGLEAMSLDLEGTNLVTLSACESGKGIIEPGEGVFGLPRAFRAAGAQNILMSLWKVPDKETSELMTQFYKNLLDGESKIDALRDAQRTTRAIIKKRYNEDIPLFWSGFVLIGY